MQPPAIPPSSKTNYKQLSKNAQIVLKISQRLETNLGATSERQGNYFIPKDDPDYEEDVTNNAIQKDQRCLAKSPRQSTRRVQDGGDAVQVSGQKFKRKD